jgi:hypothetical protein
VQRGFYTGCTVIDGDDLGNKESATIYTGGGGMRGGGYAHRVRARRCIRRGLL